MGLRIEPAQTRTAYPTIAGARFQKRFGLTPKEYSSCSTRHLGRISKRGDRYLRMLLTHGARSALRAATVARHARYASANFCSYTP
jgi:transposase